MKCELILAAGCVIFYFPQQHKLYLSRTISGTRNRILSSVTRCILLKCTLWESKLTSPAKIFCIGLYFRFFIKKLEMFWLICSSFAFQPREFHVHPSQRASTVCPVLISFFFYLFFFIITAFNPEMPFELVTLQNVSTNEVTDDKNTIIPMPGAEKNRLLQQNGYVH